MEEKYRLTLKSSTGLSNVELAEVYDVLLEQAAQKAAAEPAQRTTAAPAEASPVHTISVSADLVLEIWPRGGGDTPPLVTLRSVGQNSAAGDLGLVVIWQSEILPLVQALTQAAMMLAERTAV